MDDCRAEGICGSYVKSDRANRLYIYPKIIIIYIYIYNIYDICSYLSDQIPAIYIFPKILIIYIYINNIYVDIFFYSTAIIHRLAFCLCKGLLCVCVCVSEAERRNNSHLLVCTINQMSLSI